MRQCNTGQLKVLELCAGIGGFSVAHGMCSDPNRFKTVAFVEMDEFCQDVLRKRFPGTPIMNDLRTIGKDELREQGVDQVDVVCAGFPCQPFSVAGKQAGFEDPRADIFPHILRIVREVGAKYILLENVPAVLTYAEKIAGEMAKVCDFFEWDVVSAGEVGATHLRKRWWCAGVVKANIVDNACGK